MRDTDYISIQGWMVSKLHLKGNKLLIYAIIHGFSKDGVNEFDGSLNYIARFLSISKRSVVDSLGDLRKAKLIQKKERSKGNSYKALVSFSEIKSGVFDGKVKSKNKVKKPSKTTNLFSAKNALANTKKISTSSAKNAPLDGAILQKTPISSAENAPLDGKAVEKQQIGSEKTAPLDEKVVQKMHLSSAEIAPVSSAKNAHNINIYNNLYININLSNEKKRALENFFNENQVVFEAVFNNRNFYENILRCLKAEKISFQENQIFDVLFKFYSENFYANNLNGPKGMICTRCISYLKTVFKNGGLKNSAPDPKTVDISQGRKSKLL